MIDQNSSFVTRSSNRKPGMIQNNDYNSSPMYEERRSWRIGLMSHTFCASYILCLIHSMPHTFCASYILCLIHSVPHTFYASYILCLIHSMSHKLND